VSNPDLPARERVTASFQGRMFQAMREHNVRMRQDLILFWRALAVLDSTAQRIPGGFNLLASIRKFFADHAPGLAEFIRQNRFQPAQLQTLESLHLNAIRAVRLGIGRRPRWEKVLPANLSRRENAAVRTAALAVAGIAVAVLGGDAGSTLTIFCVIAGMVCFVTAAQQSCRRT
jgi:ubiquinone biosynthesis protein